MIFYILITCLFDKAEILSTIVNYLVVLFLLFHIHVTVLINTKLPLCEGKSIVEIVNNSLTAPRFGKVCMRVK